MSSTSRALGQYLIALTSFVPLNLSINALGGVRDSGLPVANQPSTVTGTHELSASSPYTNLLPSGGCIPVRKSATSAQDAGLGATSAAHAPGKANTPAREATTRNFISFASAHSPSSPSRKAS